MFIPIVVCANLTALIQNQTNLSDTLREYANPIRDLHVNTQNHSTSSLNDLEKSIKTQIESFESQYHPHKVFVKDSAPNTEKNIIRVNNAISFMFDKIVSIKQNILDKCNINFFELLRINTDLTEVNKKINLNKKEAEKIKIVEKITEKISRLQDVKKKFQSLIDDKKQKEIQHRKELKELNKITNKIELTNIIKNFPERINANKEYSFEELWKISKKYYENEINKINMEIEIIDKHDRQISNKINMLKRYHINLFGSKKDAHFYDKVLRKQKKLNLDNAKVMEERNILQKIEENLSSLESKYKARIIEFYTSFNKNEELIQYKLDKNILNMNTKIVQEIKKLEKSFLRLSGKLEIEESQNTLKTDKLHANTSNNGSNLHVGLFSAHFLVLVLWFLLFYTF